MAIFISLFFKKKEIEVKSDKTLRAHMEEKRDDTQKK